MGAGQAIGVKHPVLDQKLSPARAAAYERNVARVMAMDVEDMLSYVPNRPMRVFCQCPNCYGGAYGNVFSWTVERPDEMTCRYCGTVFPNDSHPDDRTIKGENALGEPFSYRFHHEKTKNVRMFFWAHIMMFKRGWILDQARALGIAFHATGKPEYARRAVLILDRIAQLYPHYPAMRQWITTFECDLRRQRSSVTRTRISIGLAASADACSSTWMYCPFTSMARSIRCSNFVAVIGRPQPSRPT